jgi:hypothetical protein
MTGEERIPRCPSSLECPECSWDVLPSETGTWAEDRDPEHCPGCGALVRVAVDDGDPERAEARAVLVERGGAVVARLLSEIDRLTDQHARDGETLELLMASNEQMAAAVREDPTVTARLHTQVKQLTSERDAARERARKAERAADLSHAEYLLLTDDERAAYSDGLALASNLLRDIHRRQLDAVRDAVLLEHEHQHQRPRALPANRLLVEFTLADDTRDAADEVFAFLDSAEQLGATPDGLGWRDADIGELRIWTEGLELEPDGVTSLRSTFRVRDDLGRELPTAGIAWGSGFDLHGGPFTVMDSAKTHKIEDMIVSKAPLEAAKTYLVIVVEHPDEAVRG